MHNKNNPGARVAEARRLAKRGIKKYYYVVYEYFNPGVGNLSIPSCIDKNPVDYLADMIEENPERVVRISYSTEITKKQYGRLKKVTNAR